MIESQSICFAQRNRFVKRINGCFPFLFIFGLWKERLAITVHKIAKVFAVTIEKWTCSEHKHPSFDCFGCYLVDLSEVVGGYTFGQIRNSLVHQV
ncbi:hypothetical protein D3C80_1257440 [compost metagenome]